MFDREWTKNDQENHCPEDGHSFRPGIAFTISTNQLHLQENDREGLKLFGIYWPSGKTGLLFQMFRCSWQFSVFKNSCSIYFPTGKQPWSWASASPRKIKNIRICMGKNLPFQKKTRKWKTNNIWYIHIIYNSSSCPARIGKDKTRFQSFFDYAKILGGQGPCQKLHCPSAKSNSNK